MAIQLRAANSATVGSGSTVAVVMPAGSAAGDLDLIVLRIGLTGVTVTQTAGTPTWLIQFQGNNAGTNYTYAFAVVNLTAGFTAPTFSWGSSTNNMYSVIGLKSSIGAPLAVDAWSALVNTSATSNTVTPNAITAAGAGEASVILTDARASATSSATDTGTFTPPTNWTTPASGTAFTSLSGANNRFTGVCYQLGVSGSVAPGTESLTDTGSHVYTFVVAHVLVQELTGTGAPQLTPPGRLSPVSLGLGLTAPSPAPQSPPAGQATPLAPEPPGRASPMALGLGLTAPSPAPQSPPVGQATPTPLVPPGLQSPMALGVPLTAPSPAPQAPPAGQATPLTELVPPGLQSPMALSAYQPPGSPAVAAAVPVVTPTGPASVPPEPPGRISPASLGLGLTAPSPAPQAPAAGQATSYPLTPPGLQSPMAAGLELAAPSPAPQSPPAGQATPLAAVTPPGLQSPMALSAYLPPGSAQPGPAPPPVVTVAPGLGPLTPPGRMSPMSLGLGLYAPSPGPQPPPVVPPAVVLGPAVQQAPDDKPHLKKLLLLVG